MSKKLKAKFGKGHYKNTDTWLTAVYRNNKELIDSKLITTGKEKPVRVFKQIVGEYMDQGLSPTKALKSLEKSTIFTSTKERMVSNAYNALKADKQAYQMFRELTKGEKGRYSKVDLGRFVYDKDQGIYIYDNKVIVSFTNSPYQVNVSMI